MRLCTRIMRSKCWGGVFEPIEPPIEKPETPTTPPSTEDLLTIKIEENIMAVVGTNDWRAIAYGNGKYVAYSKDKYVTTSTDGVNWTEPNLYSTSGTSYVYDCVFANGMFYLAGSQNAGYAKDTVEAGMIWKSADGITWTGAMTPAASAAGCNFKFLLYANNLFLAGCKGKIMISEDNLATRSFQALEYPTIWNHGAYGAGKFVLVDSTSLVALSTDNCKTWTTSSSEVNSLSKIAYGNGKFVAIGGG